LFGARACGDKRNRIDNETIARTAFSWTVIHGLSLPFTTGDLRNSFAARSVSTEKGSVGRVKFIWIAGANNIEKGRAFCC